MTLLLKTFTFKLADGNFQKSSSDATKSDVPRDIPLNSCWEVMFIFRLALFQILYNNSPQETIKTEWTWLHFGECTTIYQPFILLKRTPL